MSEKKLKTIVIDTVNEIQNNQYMLLHKKPDYDEWLDYGKEVYRFILLLKERGFYTVLILGYEGTGKSYGIKYLPEGTNIWYNADFKEATWKGGKQVYGSKINPSKYQVIPQTYSDILGHVDMLKSKDMFDEQPVAFIIGHVEEYKSGSKQRLRFKTLGKVATKFNIEGKFETVLYSQVESGKKGKPEYFFVTQNDGTNSARSTEEMFELKIPNNLLEVYNGIVNY